MEFYEFSKFFADTIGLWEICSSSMCRLKLFVDYSEDDASL